MALENYRRRLPEVVARDGVKKITEFSIVGGCRRSRERSDIWGFDGTVLGFALSAFVLEWGYYWKAGENVLEPVEKKLRRRVIDDPSCPGCGSNQESVVHILCNCPLAVQTWRLSPMHCRNGALFDHKLALPGVVCKWAMEYLQEFLSANSLNPLNIVSSGEGAANSWIRPSDGIFKIKVDGSWKEDMGKGGYGIVVRDYRGLFVAASMGFSQWCASSSIAEALAIRQGVHLGFQLGLGSIFVERDAQLLVKMLNGQVTTNQEVEMIIHDIQALSKNFQCCGFSFVRRTGNSVAHVLAN
ncbi:uncharacterized protein LOC131326849 [Rhododendron vialii]|uniref:uncharacterized protein LOC131326849 n=1 Tax=Rhododendron vialii TaxID=182163 RepID=UPI00265F7466|nr:uncharacterized protein LOC131326849 [Rhododendron vialii]